MAKATVIQALVAKWEACMQWLIPGKPILGFIDAEVGAGYLLWLNGGCLDATLETVKAALDHCDAGQYAWWHTVRCHLEEVNDG